MGSAALDDAAPSTAAVDAVFFANIELSSLAVLTYKELRTVAKDKGVSARGTRTKILDAVKRTMLADVAKENNDFDGTAAHTSNTDKGMGQEACDV